MDMVLFWKIFLIAWIIIFGVISPLVDAFSKKKAPPTKYSDKPPRIFPIGIWLNDQE